LPLICRLIDMPIDMPLSRRQCLLSGSVLALDASVALNGRA